MKNCLFLEFLDWEKGQGKTGQQDIVAYFPLGESDSTNGTVYLPPKALKFPKNPTTY